MYWRVPFLVSNFVDMGLTVFGAYFFLLDCIFNSVKFFLLEGLLVLKELLL
jgi:hypothetical protein